MPKNKTLELVSVRLPKQFKVKLKTEATKKDLSMTEYARQLSKDEIDLENVFNKNNNLFRRKKAQLGMDTILVLVGLIVMAIVGVIGFKVMSDINTDFQADATMTAESKALMSEVNTNYPSLMDSLFMFAFIMLWILVLITSFFADSHPIFFILAIIVLIVVIIIAGFLSNSYEELGADADLTTAKDSFPMTNFIIDKLPFVFIAITLSVALALYGKNRATG